MTGCGLGMAGVLRWFRPTVEGGTFVADGGVAAVKGCLSFDWGAAPHRPGHTPLAALAPLSSHERGAGCCWFSELAGVCWWCVYCPSPPRFPLTPGSSPGQVPTLSHGGPLQNLESEDFRSGTPEPPRLPFPSAWTFRAPKRRLSPE